MTGVGGPLESVEVPLIDGGPRGRSTSNRAAADLDRRTSRRVYLAAILIAGSAATAYWPSLSGEFVYDDQYDIVENTAIRHLWPIWQVFATSGPDGGLRLHSRPVVQLSFALNYAWGGLSTWQFHVTNLAIHVLAGLTLFGIVRRTLLLPRARDLAAAAEPLALARRSSGLCIRSRHRP